MSMSVYHLMASSENYQFPLSLSTDSCEDPLTLIVMIVRGSGMLQMKRTMEELNGAQGHNDASSLMEHLNVCEECITEFI